MTCNEFSYQTEGYQPLPCFLYLYISVTRSGLDFLGLKIWWEKNSMSMEKIMSKTKSCTHMGNGGDCYEVVTT